GIGRECSEERFRVLPRLAAERGGDHVHDAHAGRWGRGRGRGRRGLSIRWVVGSPAGCDDEGDRGGEGGGAHGYGLHRRGRRARRSKGCGAWSAGPRTSVRMVEHSTGRVWADRGGER